MSFLQSSGGLLGTSQDLLPSDEFKELSLSEKWERTKNFSIAGSADRSADTKTVAAAVGASLSEASGGGSGEPDTKVAEVVHRGLIGDDLKKAQDALDARVRGRTTGGGGGGGAAPAPAPKYTKEELVLKEAEIKREQQERLRGKRAEIDKFVNKLIYTEFNKGEVAHFKKFIKDNEMTVMKFLSEKNATPNQRLSLEHFMKMREKLPGIEKRGELPDKFFNP